MEVTLLEAVGFPKNCILSVRTGTTRRQAPADTDKFKLAFPSDTSLAQNVKVDALLPLGGISTEFEPGVKEYELTLAPPPGGDPGAAEMRVKLQVRDVSGPSGSGASSGGVLPVGTRVEAHYQLLSGDISYLWYKATIVCANNDGTFRVEYEDGDVWEEAPLEHIRVPKEEDMSEEQVMAMRRHQAAVHAKSYFEDHAVMPWAQTLFADLAREMPDDPWAYIEKMARERRESEVPLGH